MAEPRAYGNGSTIILACSGGCNVGQISNQAAIQLCQNGWGQFSCLAGLGGHIDGIIESTLNCDRVLVIDGCQIACAKHTLERLDLSISAYIDVTRLGITKTRDLVPAEEDVRVVVDRAIELLRQARPTAASVPSI